MRPDGSRERQGNWIAMLLERKQTVGAAEERTGRKLAGSHNMDGEGLCPAEQNKKSNRGCGDRTRQFLFIKVHEIIKCIQAEHPDFKYRCPRKQFPDWTSPQLCVSSGVELGYLRRV